MSYLHIPSCALLDESAFAGACHAHDQEERGVALVTLAQVPGEAREVVQLLLVVIVRGVHHGLCMRINAERIELHSHRFVMQRH